MTGTEMTADLAATREMAGRLGPGCGQPPCITGTLDLTSQLIMAIGVVFVGKETCFVWKGIVHRHLR